MTFGKRKDDCWHWEYTGPYMKSNGKKLRRFRLGAVILVITILIFVLLTNESLRKDPKAILLCTLDLVVCAAVPFVILQFRDRYGKQGCTYTASEQSYGPFPALNSSGRRHVGFYYINIHTMTRCPERDAIIININGDIPGTIYADAEDFEAVWTFFRERRPEAEATEPVTGTQYDELFGIETEREN